MTTFPRAPRLTKGAIVGIDPFNPLASVIVFQYNPKTMTRRLEARAAGSDGAQSEVLRLSGPPVETIDLEVEIDATDQLETGDATAATLGIYPPSAWCPCVWTDSPSRSRSSIPRSTPFAPRLR